MSRTAEEEQLLEERLLAMKKKNEELRRRHREVEADKQTAAKQNALVKMSIPHDDDWIPGRHDDSPRQDRSHQNTEASSSSNVERSDERTQRSDFRRSRNEGHREDSYNRQNDDSVQNFRPMLNSQNFSSRRNDNQSNRQRSDDRFYGHDNRTEDWSGSGRSHDGAGVRSREWAPRSNRGYRNSTQPSSGDGSRSDTSTFPSKVFKNSSMGPDRGKRPAYRLAEGDGPPPDPSYSFLTDSMRDSQSQESTEKKRGYTNRRGFPRSRGRGGESWNNRGFSDSRNNGFEERGDAYSRPSDDAWRRERSLIDQERINRQKTSDGNWSREWDSNKVLQDGNDRPNRWRRGNQTQNFDRGFPQRGYYNNRNPRQNFAPQKNDCETTDDAAGKQEHDQSPSKNKFVRRGRFSNQHKFKDNPLSNDGTAQQSSSCAVEDSRDIEDAALIDSDVKTVEKLQVSLVCDASGAQRRSVEGVGGNLRISVSTDGEHHESTVVEQRRPRKLLKAKRNRALSSTSTGTTGTAEEDDGSWEDVSSDDDVSIVTELQKISHQEIGIAKSADVSSGPESLDPIPAPGKEDEFLWDDFHPAGFQDNATVDMDTAAAFKALLDEKAKEVDSEADASSQPPKVSFRLDTSCLEDSGDEGNGSKLDPLLVTTQIVQAEVDCMSLTSIPTDTSLPEDVSQFFKTKIMKDERISEEDIVPASDSCVSAEELSGPISIIDVSVSKPREEDGNNIVQCDLRKAKFEEELDYNSAGPRDSEKDDNVNENPPLQDQNEVGNSVDCKNEVEIPQAEEGKIAVVDCSTSSPSSAVRRGEAPEGDDCTVSQESQDSALNSSFNDDDQVSTELKVMDIELREPLACEASGNSVSPKGQVYSGEDSKQTHEVSESTMFHDKAKTYSGEVVKESSEMSEDSVSCNKAQVDLGKDAKQSPESTEHTVSDDKARVDPEEDIQQSTPIKEQIKENDCTENSSSSL